MRSPLLSALLLALLFGLGCSAQRGTPVVALESSRVASKVSEKEGDLLVVLRPTVVASQIAAQMAGEYGIEALASWRMEALGLDCVVFRVGSGFRLDFLERRLALDRRVEMVQRNQLFELEAEPSPSTESGTSYGRNRRAIGPSVDSYAKLQYAPRMMAIDGAHSLVTGRGITIGVIDTGADLAHPDLEGQIVGARTFVGHDESFTADRHGTAVVGAIAAVAGNGVGIGGVAPGVRVELLKACWYPDGEDRAVCSSYTLALALDYAIQRELDVLNLSLGGPADPLLSRFVEAAIERGAAVVGVGGAESFPSSVAGVIAVEACDSDRRLWPRPEAALGAQRVVAPGAEILSLTPGGGYDFFSGRSMAVANVSGLVALLLEAEREVDHMTLRQALIDTSSRGVTGGVPVVDACAALRRIANLDCSTPSLSSPTGASVKSSLLGGFS